MSFIGDVFKTVGGVMGKVGGKILLGDLALTVLGIVPKLVAAARTATGPDRAAAIKEILERFDDLTGVGGFDLIKTLPPEKEEILWDHVKGIAEICLEADLLDDPAVVMESGATARLMAAELDNKISALLDPALQPGANRSPGGQAPPGAQAAAVEEFEVVTAILRNVEAQVANPGGYSVGARFEILTGAVVHLLNWKMAGVKAYAEMVGGE